MGHDRLGDHYSFGHTGRSVQRFGAEFSPGRLDGLPSPVSRPDPPIPLPLKAQGHNGHPPRDAPTFDESTPAVGNVACFGLGPDHHRGVTALEVRTNIDLGR